MGRKILLAEDEKSIRDLLLLNLEIEGYDVDVVGDGKSAINIFKSNHYDIVVLDVMMPEIDGFSVCEKIRKIDKEVPILFLTARGQDEDKIEGLKKGADDYLVKPFNLEELLLRVQNLVKRSVKAKVVTPSTDSFVFGVNEVDFSRFEIKNKQGELKQISEREIGLLKLLIENDGRVVSRNDILNKVWGYEKFPTTRTIDNYILMFRKYFELDQKNPIYFHSIRGVGYKFTSGNS